MIVITTTYLRRAVPVDLPAIIAIITDAKAYLKAQGIDQWQDGYPAAADLTQDIDDGITYVLSVDDQVVGTAALHQGIDVDYLSIEDGRWVNGTEARYAAIHRIAVSSQFRGQHLSRKLMSGLLTIASSLGYRDIRIDTHPDNLGMQHVITSNGFTHRGTVYMHASHAKRLAYQLLIK